MESHPLPLWRPTRGPRSSVQGATLWVTPTMIPIMAPTMATEAGLWHISHPPSQSFNVTLEHLGSL